MSNLKFMYLFELDDKGSIKEIDDKFKKLETRLKSLEKTNKKYRDALKKTTQQQKKQRIVLRNLHGTFSVFRSKLLLAAFAVNLYGRSIGQTVKASQNQLVAEKRLQTAIISTGREAQFAAAQLTSYASVQQSLTGVGDEAIIGAQALLLTFTKIGQDVFPDATESILNISAAMGQDLQQTTIQVGKALNDPVQGMSALRRVGIQLSKTQQQQVKRFVAINEVAEAQKIIIGELNTQFGGMAIAMGSTGAGAMQKAKSAFGDLLEQIGNKLSPTIVRLAGLIEETATSMKDPAEQYILALTKIGATEEFIRAEQTRIAKERVNNLLKEHEALGGIITDNTDLEILMQKVNFEMGQNTNVIKEGSSFLQEYVANLRDEGVAREKILLLLDDQDDASTTMLENIIHTNANLEIENENFQKVILALQQYVVLLGEAGTQGESTEKIQANLGATISDTFGLMFAPDMTGGEKIQEFIVKILNLFQGVILGSRQVQSSLKHMFDPIRGTAKIVGALLLLQAAKAAVRNVKFAATGMNEVVTQPTMIIAGEAGAERVNITPLSGNSSARQSSEGGGVTVNITGGVVDQDYVRNELIPALNRATGTGSIINA